MFDEEAALFVQFEPVVDLFAFVTRNTGSGPDFLEMNAAFITERLHIYAQELVAVQQDVCQVALSAEEISAIEAYYTGPLAQYVLQQYK